MAAYFPTEDKYGNDSESVVYKTLLDRKEARRVDWDDARYLDWPLIWPTSLMHPDLRGANR
jgi:hypothetical protein